MPYVTHVTRKDEMPASPHFAIIHYQSVYIPGDERSRTNPGHGYPAENRPIVTYHAFMRREDWLEAIRRLEASKLTQSYTAIEARPVVVQTDVVVSVS